MKKTFTENAVDKLMQKHKSLLEWRRAVKTLEAENRELRAALDHANASLEAAQEMFPPREGVVRRRMEQRKAGADAAAENLMDAASALRDRADAKLTEPTQ